MHYVGADNVLWTHYWNGSQWTNEQRGGPRVAFGTSPAVTLNAAPGRQDLWYSGEDGSLRLFLGGPGGWAQEGRGGQPVASASSPAVISDQATTHQYAWYTGQDRSIWVWWWSSATSWIQERRWPRRARADAAAVLGRA